MEIWPSRTIMIDRTIGAVVASSAVSAIVTSAAKESSTMRNCTVIGEPYRLTDDEVCLGVWCFGADMITPPGRVLVMATILVMEEGTKLRLSAASSPVGPHTILGGRDITPPQLALALDECVKALLTHFEIK